MKRKQIKAFEEMYYVAQSKENPEEYMSLLNATCPIQSGYTMKFRSIEEANKYIESFESKDKYVAAKVFKRYEVEVEEE